MGYDIRLIDKKTKREVDGRGCEVLSYGSTYRSDENGRPVQMGSTIHFSITYNYRELFCKYIHKEDGIRYLYGKKLDHCIQMIEDAIYNIRYDYKEVYYKSIYCEQQENREYNHFLRDLVYVRSKKPVSIKKMKQLHDNFDYWATTPYNVVKALDHIVNCLYWITSHYTKKEYNNFVLTGD